MSAENLGIIGLISTAVFGLAAIAISYVLWRKGSRQVFRLEELSVQSSMALNELNLAVLEVESAVLLVRGDLETLAMISAREFTDHPDQAQMAEDLDEGAGMSDTKSRIIAELQAANTGSLHAADLVSTLSSFGSMVSALQGLYELRRDGTVVWDDALLREDSLIYLKRPAKQ